MTWYALMLNRDREDSFESDRNMTEYLASFINGEAVRQTREARDKQKVVSDEDFDQILRNEFGRDLTEEAMQSGIRAETEDAKPIQPQKKKGSISIEDIKRYTGLELDEVKFHPHKK